jgi:hypothetical protein
MADEFKRGSWAERGNHHVYFGAFGQTYAVTVDLRTDELWCFDWQGTSGIVSTQPEFDDNRNVYCPEVRVVAEPPQPNSF